MKITSCKVIVCSPGRNFVTLKVVTDEGVHGVGDATLCSREKAVAAYLENYVVPILLGQDPHRIEDIWQQLYRGAYWRRGPVTMTAIAAVDTALWDIKAKVAGLPLYQLLGGKCRQGVLVYGHANGADLPELIDQYAAYVDLGYRAIRAQCGIQGLPATYGVAKEKMYYEPAQGRLPQESIWSSEKYLSSIPNILEAVRARFGFDHHLLHDVHHRLRPIEAAALGKAVEALRLFWLEDAVTGELQEGYRLLRQHTVTPLAIGEVFNSIYDCKTLIEEQLIDYIRTTVTHAGGITHLRRIASFADLHHVRTGSHGATDLSPISMGAALHFDIVTPNFGIQEYMRHTAETDAVFPHDYRFEDGYLIPGDTPGHGADIDEGLASKYPYERNYLPINRLEDGTMWNW